MQSHLITLLCMMCLAAAPATTAPAPALEIPHDLAAWEAQRVEILKQWQQILGPLPDRPALEVKIISTEDLPDHTRLLVGYTNEPGTTNDAYLLLPKTSGPHPAMVCLHPTSKTTLRDPVGLANREQVHHALHLVHRGYVCIAPRNYLWEVDGRNYQQAADELLKQGRFKTGLARMLYDAMRAVDLLVDRPEVDRTRIGVIGHSFGGKEALILAAFDDRIRAAISCEGGIGLSFSNWDADWYLGPQIKSPSFHHDNHELLALIAPRPSSSSAARAPTAKNRSPTSMPSNRSGGSMAPKIASASFVTPAVTISPSPATSASRFTAGSIARWTTKHSADSGVPFREDQVVMSCESLESRLLFAAAPQILFIRGATRSGGFLEGTNAATRNEQLADITNTSTSNGNAGWGSFAQALRDNGFSVSQMTEAKEPDAPATGFVNGRPIRFENLDLSPYAAIVFGSNNARYSKASVDAIATYIANGGSALFISDANFGSNWRDSPDSDQAFLARFGLIVNQDSAAGVTTLTRAAGDFVAPTDPVLAGVNSFTGEGTSPIVIPDTPPPGVHITRVVRATGQTRNNNGVDPSNQFQGSLRAVNDHDAALVTATVSLGRLAAFFDRNTFFNDNGVGTDITQANNRRLALNLINWLTDQTPPSVTSTRFTQGAPSVLRLTFNDNLAGSLTRSDILLRDPFDGTPIPRARWSFGVTESATQSVLEIHIKGAQPPGPYQLQINPHKITDDAGNSNSKRIRYNFTILSAGGAAVPMQLHPALTIQLKHRNIEDIFSAAPILLV